MSGSGASDSFTPLPPSLPFTLREAAERLERGETTSRALVEMCIERVETCGNARAAYDGAFNADRARRYADAADHIRAKGYQASPLAGLPISIKGLFDLAGDVTRAGSLILADRPPAGSDAKAIGHLRAAGFILLGHTQMTEFAYSGLGLNPHGPQPVNTLVDTQDAVPGGSSSGGAVSVATGAALAAIGSDTGGSCRIPAAFNGLTGFKPTASRISREGMIPLSPSFDSVGAMARDVRDCALLDHIMAGHNPMDRAPSLIARDRKEGRICLLLPTSILRDDADSQVLAVFEAALKHLEQGGIEIVRRPLPLLETAAGLNLQGQIVAAESYLTFHDDLLLHPERFDPRVRERIEVGESIPVATLRDLYIERQKLCAQFASEMSDFDAMICPTVPILPPAISACQDKVSYGRYNRLVLRNPSFANLFDGCAITLPMQWEGLPAGLMLTASNGKDQTLLSVAERIERRLKI
ncbi:amidase [Swaminathania salitolerans]|uniref:Amidase n=1 Tax=Swaminathania salitolerans TaxID=182838 RepID=A0A511BVG5_9PROT|nr:amidase [Swaminathania salitolerans]GBQ15122.1 amidase [Swaminathania salitolerans LMG 21291]GEL01998.1 amidase [Swaminathania salitolerans]